MYHLTPGEIDARYDYQIANPPARHKVDREISEWLAQACSDRGNAETKRERAEQHRENECLGWALTLEHEAQRLDRHAAYCDAYVRWLRGESASKYPPQPPMDW